MYNCMYNCNSFFVTQPKVTKAALPEGRLLVLADAFVRKLQELRHASEGLGSVVEYAVAKGKYLSFAMWKGLQNALYVVAELPVAQQIDALKPDRAI